MRKQYRPITSSPNQKHSVRPHPLTQHLSLLHTASLLPVCSILLLLSGKLLKSPVDTASSTTSASWRRGFTALFWPGEDNTDRVWRRGDIPRVWMYRNIRPAWAEVRFVYLRSDFPSGFDIILSYTILPLTLNSLSEIPTVLKKRDAHDFHS